MHRDKYFGLVDLDSNKLVQLTDVKISCTIANLTSCIEATFTYYNQLEQPAQANFRFPLNDVAVFSFEAVIKDRVVVAECRPRKEAQSVYDEAVAKGQTAILLHQDEHTQDVFAMRIGQIPVKETVTIKLKCVGHLEVGDISGDKAKGVSELVFTLPSVICPRYTPSVESIDSEFDPLSGVTWTTFPYTITFEADLYMPGAVESVTSERDNFTVVPHSTDSKRAKVTLGAGFKPDHALQMRIRVAEALRSFALIESGQSNRTSVLSQHCLMAQFLPDFKPVSDEQDVKTELIFVVDRSGSMEGQRIQQASESLQLFLSSLPPGCRFQIIGFGSTHSALFPEPVDYTEATLAQAQEYQTNLKADMGGTEILAPLRAAFDSPLTGQGWYKEVILLTDGDVWNVDEIIGLIASNVHKARVFTVGIGLDSPPAMLAALARAGRGVSTSVRDATQLRSAVVKILSSALQPRATVTQVKWDVTAAGDQDNGKPHAVSLVTAPALPPPVFNGSYTTVYALFDGDPSRVTGTVSLRLELLGEEKTLSIPIGSTHGCPVLPASDDAPVHRLAGKCLISELNNQYKARQMKQHEATEKDESTTVDKEEDQETKNLRLRIEQLSCLLNIISPYTSFVGVDPSKKRCCNCSIRIFRTSYGWRLLCSPISLYDSRTGWTVSPAWWWSSGWCHASCSS